MATYASGDRGYVPNNEAGPSGVVPVERQPQSIFGSGFFDFNSSSSELRPGHLVNDSSRDTQAALARADWEDYKSRFFPLEDKLINQYDNKSLRDAGIAENVGAVNSAYDVDKGVQQRRLSRYGVNLSPDQQASINRQRQVSRTGAVADTKNLTRQAYADLDDQIMTGNSSSMSEVGN